MANNIPDDSFESMGIETPEDVQAQQDRQFAMDQAGPYRTSASEIFSGASRLGQALLGNPRLEQAQNTQQAVGNAISDSDANAPDDEDGLSGQIRRLKATYAAVAPLNPNAALQVSNRLAVLTSAQAQQRKLFAQTDMETAQAQLREDQDRLDLAQKGTMIVGSADGTKQYGQVQVFDGSGRYRPEWQQEAAQLRSDSNDPNAVTVQQDRWFANKLMQTQLKGQLALQQAANKQAAGTQLSEAGLRQAVVESAIYGEGVMSRFDQDTKKAVMNFKGDNGITPDLELQARAQVKALYANANAQGRREGNVDYLSQSVNGLGQNVLTALDGVTRTNLQPLNSAIAAGKTASGDPGEAAYSASIQSFVQEYSRVINGGTGQTSDAARREALAMLNNAQSPEQVKSVMQMLTKREIDVLNNATPAAVEALRNPDKYKAVLKIQKAAGIQMAPDDSGDTAAPGMPSTAGAGMTAPTGAGQSDAGGFIPGRQYRDAQGNVGTYLGNGRWK